MPKKNIRMREKGSIYAIGKMRLHTSDCNITTINTTLTNIRYK